MKDSEELLNGYFDGTLTSLESAQLRAWLAADRDHMRRFVRASVIHSRLRDVLHETDLCGVVYAEALGDTIDPQHIASLLDEEEAAARRRREIEATVPQAQVVSAGFDRQFARQPRHEERPRLAHGLVYAAFAVAAAVVVMAFRQVSPPPMPVNVPDVVVPAPAVAPIIAQVTKGLAASITSSDSEVIAGQQLTSGPLTIASGVMELAFTSGVKIVVEGPAELSLLSADRAKLLRGRVVVNVPKQALGFTLLSEAAAFVDLGTEFGVEVDDAGAASIHVLDGEVAVVADKKGNAPSRMLQRGAASAVSTDGGARDIPFDETHFLRRVPASTYELAVLKSKPLAYWWLDQQHPGEIILGGGRHARPARASAGIKFKVTTARRDEATPRRAALFAGEHDGIDIAANERLGAVNNFTCEAWVLPGDASSGPQRIFSTFDRPHSGLAIGVVDGGWYKLPQDTLRFQLTTYGGYDCISKSPISADRWVHMAATIDQQGEPTLYVDGEAVEMVYRVSGETFDPQTFEDIPAVWSDSLPADQGKAASRGEARIGCNPPGPERRRISPELWQGQIANVALYDRVLSDQEIRAHFQATRDRSVELSRKRP